MEYPKDDSNSLYDYSDKSIPHAGYAAMAYAAINLFGGLLAVIQYFLYHRPGKGGSLYHQEANQLWLQHTPLLTAISVAVSVAIAAISGVLAFYIFRRSRFAVIAMLVFVVAFQLYTWVVARSLAGTLPSIIIVGFLLRGARRIFQEHALQKMQAEEA
ncbi:MAG: hypothetical protein ABI787_06865 [Spartobacteria bacterium]